MTQFTPPEQPFPSFCGDVQLQILSELKAIRELLAAKTRVDGLRIVGTEGPELIAPPKLGESIRDVSARVSNLLQKWDEEGLPVVRD